MHGPPQQQVVVRIDDERERVVPRQLGEGPMQRPGPRITTSGPQPLLKVVRQLARLEHALLKAQVEQLLGLGAGRHRRPPDRRLAKPLRKLPQRGKRRSGMSSQGAADPQRGPATQLALDGLQKWVGL
jgi:hypothetical protein